MTGDLSLPKRARARAQIIRFLVELFSKSSLGFGARIGVLKISEGCFGVPVESRENGISFLQSFFLCACGLKEKSD